MTVWFSVAETVHVESFEAVTVDAQIKAGGRGLLLLRDEGGVVVRAVHFAVCHRIDSELVSVG